MTVTHIICINPDESFMYTETLSSNIINTSNLVVPLRGWLLVVTRPRDAASHCGAGSGCAIAICKCEYRHSR